MKARKENFKEDPGNLHCVRSCTLCKGRRWLAMTANQVAFWQLQESIRHNKADELVRSASQQAQAERFKAQERHETGLRTLQKEENVRRGFETGAKTASDLFNAGAKVAAMAAGGV